MELSVNYMNCHKLRIIEQIHEGRNNIYIVEHNEKTCIFKKPKNSSKNRKKPFKRQLERIKFWRRHRLSNIKAVRYHDGILKTYIKGNTLYQIIDKNKHFFSENNKELKALGRFIRLLIKR